MDTIASGIKAEAHKLIESLRDNATWEDLMDSIHVRQAIERGLEDSVRGRTIPVEKLRARYGFSA